LRSALGAVALAAALAGACSSSSPAKDAGSSLCNGPMFVSSGNLTCAQTFDEQTANPPPMGVNDGTNVSGPCGGYLVWLNDGMRYAFACVYDPTTKKLAGAIEVTDTGVPCSGAAKDLPASCTRHTSYPEPDAGAAAD
jgi:hypothetical protein